MRREMTERLSRPGVGFRRLRPLSWACLAVIALVVAGALTAATAATARRGVDETIMRVLDVIMAFPGIALAAVLVAVFGGSIPVLVMAMAFLYMPSVARVVRANVLAQYG